MHGPPANTREPERVETENRWDPPPRNPAPSPLGHLHNSTGKSQLQTPGTLVPTTNLHAAGNVSAFPRSLSIESWNRPMHSERPPPGRRASCKTFSRKSRLAMFKTFSKTDFSQLGVAWWISLTYHNRWPAGKPQLEADREAWLERIRRKFPAIQYIRRLDFQTRGMPHHHYILWSHIDDHRFEDPRTARWIARIWHEIAEPESQHHRLHGAKVKPVTSYRMLITYVSRYAAKESGADDGFYQGRRWSCSYHLPTRPNVEGQVNAFELRLLKKIIRRLMIKRGATRAMIVNLYKGHTDAFALLREGEPERILMIAGLLAKPPPEGVENDP